MNLKYVGISDVRRIEAKDFKSIGVEDQKLIEVRQGEVVEVSDAAAEWLLANEKSDWKEAKDEPDELTFDDEG